MKFFTQTYEYDDPWPIVTLAYFLRYPNPKASHILSCDVLSRSLSPDTGMLTTTRLLLKRGVLPRWAPKGIIARSESYVLEESEVDPYGRTVRCTTRNVEFTKVMQVEETVFFHQSAEGRTMQTTEARIRSGVGWGLTKRFETYGLQKFKTNIQRSREGFSIVLDLLRQSRLQTLGPASSMSFLSRRSETLPSTTNANKPAPFQNAEGMDTDEDVPPRPGPIKRLRNWLGA